MSAAHIPGGKYDHVDQWLGSKDTTSHAGISVPTEPVTVDPVGNSAWIHEGDSNRYQDTKNRGRAYDRADVKSLLGVLDGMLPISRTMFEPSVSDIGKDRYLSRASAHLPLNRPERDQPCVPHDVRPGHRDESRSSATAREAELLAWRGKTADPSNYGRMPAIRKMLDEGRLPDKSADVIQREMLEAQQRATDRMNDRSGQPDHGKAC